MLTYIVCFLCPSHCDKHAMHIRRCKCYEHPTMSTPLDRQGKKSTGRINSLPRATACKPLCCTASYIHTPVRNKCIPNPTQSLEVKTVNNNQLN